MNYEDVILALEKRDMTMSRYERDDWDNFVRKINLSISFPFVHIAGSNGKGSTAHYLYEIYRAKGYKVALFSKPYIKKPNEMMMVNEEAISDIDFARIYSTNQKEIEKANLSTFEIETYIAFSYFNEQKPDIAIIECGMGGVLDSTNILSAKPLLSVITTISLEHTNFLGVSLAEIALNKAGIIKENCPTLVGKLADEALKQIREIAHERHSEVTIIDDYHHDHYESPYFHFDYHPYSDLTLLTPASYQLNNAAIAIEATKILANRYPIDEFSLRKGLLKEPLPCRYEKHRNVIIDGAHNPEAIRSLMITLSRSNVTKRIHVLFASFRDKNIAVELPLIDNVASDITLTTFSHPRARDEMDYFLYSEDHQFVGDYRVALNNLIAQYPDDIIVVTGSLAFTYLVRDYVKEILRL